MGLLSTACLGHGWDPICMGLGCGEHRGVSAGSQAAVNAWSRPARRGKRW